jgi:hypothetical protein
MTYPILKTEPVFPLFMAPGIVQREIRQLEETVGVSLKQASPAANHRGVSPYFIDLPAGRSLENH